MAISKKAMRSNLAAANNAALATNELKYAAYEHVLVTLKDRYHRDFEYMPTDISLYDTVVLKCAFAAHAYAVKAANKEFNALTDLKCAYIDKYGEDEWYISLITSIWF